MKKEKPIYSFSANFQTGHSLEMLSYRANPDVLRERLSTPTVLVSTQMNELIDGFTMEENLIIRKYFLDGLTEEESILVAEWEKENGGQPTAPFPAPIRTIIRDAILLLIESDGSEALSQIHPDTVIRTVINDMHTPAPAFYMAEGLLSAAPYVPSLKEYLGVDGRGL